MFLSFSKLGHLISSGHLGYVANKPFNFFPRKLGKHHTLPFDFSGSVSYTSFDLIHFDIWGPSPTLTM